MTQPKYPAGTLLRHRASGEKVLVTHVRFGPPEREMPPIWIYEIESGPIACRTILGDEAVDLRYERVTEPGVEWTLDRAAPGDCDFTVTPRDV